jgi:hypothetical protein
MMGKNRTFTNERVSQVMKEAKVKGGTSATVVVGHGRSVRQGCGGSWELCVCWEGVGAQEKEKKGCYAWMWSPNAAGTWKESENVVCTGEGGSGRVVCTGCTSDTCHHSPSEDSFRVGQCVTHAFVSVAGQTDGRTPLFVASQNGHVQVVRALLGAGAAVNQATVREHGAGSV